LYFCLNVRSLLGAVAVTPPKKKVFLFHRQEGPSVREARASSSCISDAFSSRFFKTNVLFLYSFFSSTYISFMFPLASFSGVLKLAFYAIAQLPSLADIAV